MLCGHEHEPRCVYEIMTNKIPYEDKSDAEAVYALVHDGTRPRLPDQCTGGEVRLAIARSSMQPHHP